MSKKMKTTGFARFVMMMLVVCPLAYLAATYYNGEDGVAKVKHFLGLDKTAQTTSETIESDDDTADAPITMPKGNINDQIEILESENRELRATLRAKELEVRELRRQNELLKKTH
jgi:hypothetical protein